MAENIENKWATYTFTEEEAKQNAKDLAQKLQDAEAAENQLTSIKSEFKAKIDLLKAAITDLRNKVASGTEQRQYRCRVVLDIESKTRIYIDAQTGETIATSPFRAEDYQTALEI